jgi:hypothetical protein
MHPGELLSRTTGAQSKPMDFPVDAVSFLPQDVSSRLEISNCSDIKMAYCYELQSCRAFEALDRIPAGRRTQQFIENYVRAVEKSGENVHTEAVCEAILHTQLTLYGMKAEHNSRPLADASTSFSVDGTQMPHHPIDAPAGNLVIELRAESVLSSDGRRRALAASPGLLRLCCWAHMPICLGNRVFQDARHSPRNQMGQQLVNQPTRIEMEINLLLFAFG